MSNLLISIVSPVYKAEAIIEELVRQLTQEVSKITDNFEIILVEDCGADNSWHVIEDICKKNNKVKGFKLSRNFGQHYAITAGLDKCKGEWIVVIDCDLQDRPDQIEKLYNKALEGFDIVQGRRTNRKDGFFKKMFSAIFYKTLAYLSGYAQDSTIANYGIYNKKVISAIVQMRENIRFFPTMVNWVGFKKTAIEIEHAHRESGKSSYNFRKLINLGLDVILAYSDKPLRIMVKLGILTSVSSFIFLLYNIYKYLTGQIFVMGYASLILSIWLIAGVIIFMLGIVGLYIGKTFESTKNRPIYIIEKEVNA